MTSRGKALVLWSANTSPHLLGPQYRLNRRAVMDYEARWLKTSITLQRLSSLDLKRLTNMVLLNLLHVVTDRSNGKLLCKWILIEMKQ